MDVAPKWNYVDAGVRKDRVNHNRLRLLQAFYTEKFQDKDQVNARKKEIRKQMNMNKDDTRVLKEATGNPDDMETQVEDQPPAEHEHDEGGEEGGEEENKTDDEEVLPHHGEDPFCCGEETEEESKQKEGAEEEHKETDPLIHPDSPEDEYAEDEDEAVGDEKAQQKMLKGTPNDTEDPDRAAREEQEEDDAAKAPRGKGPKAKAKSKAKGKAKAKAVQKEDEEEEVEGKDRAEGSMIPRKRMLKRKKSIRRQLTYGENDMTKDAETPKESPKKKANRNMTRRLAFNTRAVLQFILPENLGTAKQLTSDSVEPDMIPKILLV
eukprot:s6414_g5.t1